MSLKHKLKHKLAHSMQHKKQVHLINAIKHKIKMYFLALTN